MSLQQSPVSSVSDGEEKAMQKQQQPRDTEPAPDGGLTAYTQVILTHLVCLNTWGFISSFGVFQTYYQTILPEAPTAISWIGSMQVFLIYFVGAFSGRALDAGYFRATFGLGVLLQLIGVFMTSLANKYWQLFLAQAVCVGLGSGLQFCPAMGLVATYFSRRRVFALAFALAGAGSGGLVFPAIVRQLLYNPNVGFAWTVRILGFIMLATSLLCLALYRTRKIPPSQGPLFEFRALTEPTYLLFVVGMFFNFWALYFAFYYVGQYSRTVLGFSFDNSVDLLLLVNGVGILGRLIPAYLANEFVGPLNLQAPMALVSGIVMYCWAAVHDSAGIYVFAIIYGFASNTTQGLWPSALSALTDDVTKTGARMGLGFTIISFACLTGPPLGGALLRDNATNYLGAQLWGGTSLIFGGLILAAARITKTGWVVRAKC